LESSPKYKAAWVMKNTPIATKKVSSIKACLYRIYDKTIGQDRVFVYKIKGSCLPSKLVYAKEKK